MKKTALITGASSGIGEEFAHYYAKENYNLILVARSKDKLNKMKTTFQNKYGTETLVIIADLTEEYSGKTIFKEVKESGYKVDVLVNSAGFATSGAFNELNFEKQHQEVMINATTVMDMCQLFSQEMIQSKSGTIINVASSSAYHPIPTMAVYAATKAFVLSFTEALYIEYKNQGIKVIAISPGATNTNFFDAGGGVSYGKMRKPSDVVATTMKGLKRGKLSVIDGKNNFFTSGILPRLRSRNGMATMVGSIMKKQLSKN